MNGSFQRKNGLQAGMSALLVKRVIQLISKNGRKTISSDFVLRDRNHPSVIMWSIGNEVDYPNDPYTHPILNTEANPQTWAKFSESLPHANRFGEVAGELVSVIKES